MVNKVMPELRCSCSVTLLWKFFFSSRRRHTRYIGDWSSDVCSSDLGAQTVDGHARRGFRETREQRGHPRDVAVVLPGLVGGAEPDVLDLLRRHTDRKSVV